MQRPTTIADESRYRSVKRSMGAIKFVLDERRKIKAIIEKSAENSQNAAVDMNKQ
jgi:hypothetical protein